MLFDGNCRLCRRTIRLLQATDVFRQLIPINALDTRARSDAGVGNLDPDALMEEMHVVVAHRTWSGFSACRVLAGRIPLFWPVWPFLYLWPVPILGRRVYRHVAAHRMCRAEHMSPK